MSQNVSQTVPYRSHERRKINGAFVDVYPDTTADHVTVESWHGSSMSLSEVLQDISSGGTIAPATSSTLGGVIVGSGLDVDSSGTLIVDVGYITSGGLVTSSAVVNIVSEYVSSGGYVTSSGTVASAGVADGLTATADSGYVHISGNETISGAKTFSGDTDIQEGVLQKSSTTGYFVSETMSGKAAVSLNHSTFGAVWNAPTQNYRVALATWPSTDDNVQLYSVTNENVSAGVNTKAKSLYWNASTGALSCDGGFTGTATNASSLGGVAAANYVNTTGNQNIGGTKTFTSVPIWESANTTSGGLFFKDTGTASNTKPSNARQCYFVRQDNGGNWKGWLRVYSNNSDHSGVELKAVRPTSTTTHGIEFGIESETFVYWRPQANGDATLGTGSYRWKQLYATTTTISTSDERNKQYISDVTDELLDAWANISWKQFKFKDAILEKGAENARQHHGIVAQQVAHVLEEHGLDATQFAFFCHDTWEYRPPEYETFEEKDEQGNVISRHQQKVRDEQMPGDAYSVRYEEALCIEAAYQRRRADRSEARITSLEQRLAEMEQAIAALAGGAE